MILVRVEGGDEGRDVNERLAHLLFNSAKGSCT